MVLIETFILQMRKSFFGSFLYRCVQRLRFAAEYFER